ncbi:Spherulation-specific family 4 [Clohesyomyces aquaticus]|uniref:Spherulation-specific family 4 n=1 Tax=Clohesyomyces aquaticus TaxID=1231657 RepID=A0A1Y1ZQR5_9PLEO|nr:Spherulation-specific family 4 [Clohesyomyces aquaticus]
MSILLPLYIYPWAGAWDPLYSAATAHPNLNFSVIVNPCNGPCANGLPEQAYRDEMPKLKNYHNIRTLGYVATNYTNKPIDSVIQDIYTYANWTATMNDPRVAVDGIFFDEVPGTYDWHYRDYLNLAKDAVKRSSGLGQQFIVHNPGTIPNINWNYLEIADVTVVFEDTYMNFLDAPKFNALKTLSADTRFPKSKLAVMLHTVPNIPDDLLDWTTKQIKEMADWSFLSSVQTKNEWWHSFSPIFAKFTGAVERNR